MLTEHECSPAFLKKTVDLTEMITMLQKPGHEPHTLSF